MATKKAQANNCGVKTSKSQSTKKQIKTDKIPEIKVSTKKKIIFLGSEAAPFIATGGLADVLGSLPKALSKNKNLDISVILPLYGNIREEFKSQFRFVANFNVSVGWRWQYAGVFYYEYQGVKFYFIDNEYYFKREGSIYGFYDDGEIAFSRHHNVVKVDDKYYDITSEYIIRNCDFITDNSEYCVCGELTVSEYYNICKEYDMWFTPFDHQYLGNDIYVRYENTKKIIVKGEELDNDEIKLIEFINNIN